MDTNNDKFVITLPRSPIPFESKVIKISPNNYARLANLKHKTGLSLGALADKCIQFALNRLVIEWEDDTNAET